MLLEHNFSISRRGLFFFQAISSLMCFAGNSHVQMVSRTSIGFINPRSPLEKIVTRSLEGVGGQSDPPPPSSFDTIHPIDLKIDIYI